LKKLIFLITLTVTSVLFAQEFKQEVKIGSVIFTGFEFNIDNAEFISKLDTSSHNTSAPFGYNPLKNQFETSKNSFYLERAYINVMASLMPDLKARVTPDVFSYTDGNGKTQYNLALKYAFIDYTPLKCTSGLSLGFSVGIVPNNWIGINEKYWNYRGFAKTFTDYSWTMSASKSGNSVSRSSASFFSSADLGLLLNFTAPKGFAEIQAAVFNGNGYRNLNFDNRFKDLLFTVFIHPMQDQLNKKTEALKKVNKDRIEGISDLTFGGFLYMGKLDKGENYAVNGVQYERSRFGGMAHLRCNFKKAGFISIGGEYSMQKNVDPGSPATDKAETSPKGFSAYLEFNPPVLSINEKLMLVARFDSFDPDIYEPAGYSSTTPLFDNSHGKQTLLIGGLAFKPNKMLTLGVTYQSITYQDNFVVKYDGTTAKTDSRLLLHGILSF
jgi:hypothetical protein